MKLRRLGVTAAALGLAAAVVVPPASADTGTRSLAEVLTSDGNRFDRNWSRCSPTT